MKVGLLVGTLLSAALLSLPATAQPGPGMGGGMGGEPRAAQPARDCAKARDPERCEALQKAKETCKDSPAVDRKQCMQNAMPPMDCSKARSPERCEAHQKAKETCKDKTGRDHRQCMRDNTPRNNKKDKAAKS